MFMLISLQKLKIILRPLIFFEKMTRDLQININDIPTKHIYY